MQSHKPDFFLKISRGKKPNILTGSKKLGLCEFYLTKEGGIIRHKIFIY